MATKIFIVSFEIGSKSMHAYKFGTLTWAKNYENGRLLKDRQKTIGYFHTYVKISVH